MQRKAGVMVWLLSAVAAAECVVVDVLAEPGLEKARLFGGVHLDVTDCPLSEVATLIPVAMPVAADRVSMVHRRHQDAAWLLLRLDGLPEGADLDAVLALMVPEGAALTTYAPPQPWPVHPGSSNRRDEPLPTWWDLAVEQPVRGRILQRPEALAPCHNPNAGGVLAAVADGALYVHVWTEQHFFPQGGCGG